MPNECAIFTVYCFTVVRRFSGNRGSLKNSVSLTGTMAGTRNEKYVKLGSSEESLIRNQDILDSKLQDVLRFLRK